jgi:KOW motif
LFDVVVFFFVVG